jgi:hypothetical protein
LNKPRPGPIKPAVATADEASDNHTNIPAAKLANLRKRPPTEDTVKPEEVRMTLRHVANIAAALEQLERSPLSHQKSVTGHPYRTLAGSQAIPFRAKISLSHASFPCGVTRAT